MKASLILSTKVVGLRRQFTPPDNEPPLLPFPVDFFGEPFENGEMVPV